MIRNKLANSIGRWAIAWTIVLSGCQPATPPAPAQPAVAPQVEAVTFSGPTYPPPAISIGQVQNWPATVDGHVLTYDSATGLWGPEAGGGASGSLNDLTDVIITAAATGETVRYNGTNWVDSKLASTDLSDFAAAIVGTTDDILAWNGSAWDDIPFVSAVTSEFGNGTDNFVLTADGAGGVAWEATTAGSMLTPDGLTATTTTTEFNVKAYGASGLDTQHFATVVAATSTVSVKDAAGSAATSSLVIGQGVVINGAGPACAVSAAPTVAANYTYAIPAGSVTVSFVAATNVMTTDTVTSYATETPIYINSTTTYPAPLVTNQAYYLRQLTSTTYTLHPSAAEATANTNVVDITTTGSGTHTIGVPGATTYTYQAVAGDGQLGWTEKSSDIVITVGNATLSATNFNRLRVHIPPGARSIAIYKSGVLQTVLRSQPVECDGSDADAVTFTAPVDSGGFLQFTASSGHGLAVNDVIELNFISSGDDAFDGQALVTAVSSDTITTGVAWNAGMTSGNGYEEKAYVEWDDKGIATPLHATKYMPDAENPPWDWRGGIMVPRGKICLDTASTPDHMFQAVDGQGDWRVSYPSAPTAPTEPTWPTTANGRVKDNDIFWERIPDCAPVAAPAAATNQALFTTVATTPTSSTFTTTAAPTVDVSSNTLCVMHNDALAVRTALAAIVASGKGGTLVFPPGIYPMILPLWTNSSYFTNIGTSTDPYHVVMLLNTGSTNSAHNSISLRLDKAIIRTRLCQASNRYAEITAVQGNRLRPGLIGIAGSGCSIYGDGAIEVLDWSGGNTEHDSTSSFGSQWSIGIDSGGSTESAGTTAQGTVIRGIRLTSPSIWLAGGLGTDNSDSAVNMTLENVVMEYGSGDGDQTLSATHGDFFWKGGKIWNMWRLSSHGLYWNIGRPRYLVDGVEFRDISTATKNSIQIRGSGGDTPAYNAIIANCWATRSNKILMGDTTSSNGVQKVAISNCQDFDMSIAEGRDISVVGGNYGTITVAEDSEDLTFQGFTCNSLALDATDQARNVKVDGVTCRTALSLSRLYHSKISNTTIRDPYTDTINLVSGLYEWVASGTNNEYYLTLRATGDDPSISSPTGVRVRRNITYVAGTRGSLGADTWTYGDPDGGGAITYNTITVKIFDLQRYDPDANPNGTVQTIAHGSGVVGLVFGGNTEDVHLSNISLVKSVDKVAPMLSGAAPMKDVTFDNVNTTYSGLSTGACRMWDWGSSNLSQMENVQVLNSTWKHNNTSGSETRAPIRMLLGRGGSVTFDNCNFPNYGSACDFTGSVGMLRFINNRVQTNEVSITADGSANTVAFAAGEPDLVAANATPIQMWSGTSGSAMPTSLVAGTIYYLRDGATSAVYPTAADANASTNAIDFGGATVTLLGRFPASADAAVLSSAEATGDNTNPGWFGEVRGNRWRGSQAKTYAQITSTQNNYALDVVDEHRISSDASRAITGLIGGHPGKPAKLVNSGLFDITLSNNIYPEVQTVVIASDPVSGDYTITHNGSTTGNIAWNGSSATVQTALRLLPGMGAVTVAESGTSPNFTHTVTLTGVPLNSPQMTNTDNLSPGGATITHATTTHWEAGPDRLLNHTNATITLSPLETITYVYDGASLGWRDEGN